ncbi:N-acetyl-anhydromuramyl-L-alanine amidase [Sphingosinicella microcystinivorans]|uniref:N-acetylmuramoyl-L-alanine amidase n=2 Tax=Sphingosinicella microcystinivorans TaxID=335406 RepID=A0AAD1D7T3_SPHMI|nr:N-acetylmuramoyl-L-alanine amidase [Sphingosinicella microcystinivorans]BBE34471.1 N-acetyl-anhydromuramyl-L-alanine amidase [Sphingosinicella microcystinivorans]
MIDCPSPNHDARSMPVSMVVLHYTGMQSGTAALQRLTDAEAKVSAHYMIAEDGNVLRLVDEERRAWHAGKSFWRGISDVNSASIGIEIVNPGHEFGYRPFPEAQMDALIPLLAEIVKRHGIRPGNVVGHSDIAPARKIDPGELFDWPRLARLGLATPVPEAIADPQWTDAGMVLALERYGYDVSDGPAAIVAFQRRFRPSNIDGVVDGETRAILLGLLLTTPQDELRLA